jgi:hypothetical protein
VYWRGMATQQRSIVNRDDIVLDGRLQIPIDAIGARPVEISVLKYLHLNKPTLPF